MPKRFIATLVLLVFAGLIAWVLYGSMAVPQRMKPSGSSAFIPQPDVSFEEYLRENRSRIRSVLGSYYYAESKFPFGEELPLEAVLEMRSPFQYLPDEDCDDERPASRGFLLVHGLTDSPYLLRSVAAALQTHFPCAIIQALLSPGHSTVPGDLLDVRLEHWQEIFKWGVDGLSTQVEQLTVLGYSNGSALAVDYLNNAAEESDTIDRLVLLSPGLKPADGRAFLAPYLKYLLPWINKRQDSDAAKYESFPTNAAAEFYKLTVKATAPDAPLLDVPTLMIISGDDTTTDPTTAVDVFCDKMNSSENKLIWYQSESENSQLPRQCDGIELASLDQDATKSRVASLSHIALTMPATDPHYGIDGRNPVCLSHEDFPARTARCIDDNTESVYAENTFLDENGEYNGAIVRRTSFNPDFDTMMLRIACFVRGDCEL